MLNLRKKSKFCTIIFVLFFCTQWATTTSARPENTLQRFKEHIAKPFHQGSKEVKAQNPPTQTPPALLWIRLRNNFGLPNNEYNKQVQFYIKRYTQSQNHLDDIISRARPYLHYIAQELEQHNLPAEIALLPLVESTFDPTALSSSGARGLWQLMPETGKYYGLDQDEWFDGCQDIRLSTQAALRHLSYLNKRFKGNWLHALAAYNSGEGRVSRAINKNIKANKPIDFWHLDLPKETRDYVPKLMAIVAIINAPAKYGVHLPNILNQPYFTHINIGKAVDIKQAAQLANFPEKKLTQLNPGFYKHKMNPDGPFNLCVPIHLAGNFAHVTTKLASIPKYTSQGHAIGKGDTLGKIARQYNTDIATLKSLNKLTNDVIRVGQLLKVPTTNTVALNDKSTSKTTIHNKPKVHIVKHGESLWSISKRYQVNIKDVMASNQLTQKSTLQPGQKIVILTA